MSGTYSLREPGESGPRRVISVEVRLRGVGDVVHESRRNERWNGDCLRSRKIKVEDRRLGVRLELDQHRPILGPQRLRFVRENGRMYRTLERF